MLAYYKMALMRLPSDTLGILQEYKIKYQRPYSSIALFDCLIF